MLLVVDIGNSAIMIGVFRDTKLLATWNISSGVHRLPDEYASLLLSFLRNTNLDPKEVKAIAMCSVVPPLVATFAEMFEKYFHIKPLVVGAGVRTGIRVRMDNPREVGADRIVNSVAGNTLYGRPLIVVDMGTATTFDVISVEGDYIGGAVSPGLGTSADALFLRAAKLPRVELVRPKKAVGTDTITAMQSGLIFGYVGIVESLVRRIKQEMGVDMKVVATGGYASIIARETDVIDIVDRNLTLSGLRIIYNLNKV